MDEEMAKVIARLGSTVRCPLCGEEDFDAYGLRAHFVRGWCEVAEAAEEQGPYSAGFSLTRARHGVVHGREPFKGE